MRTPIGLAVAVALPVIGCGSPGDGPAPVPRSTVPPASALAGVVGVLEALAAARPADCVVEVRALTAEVRLVSGAPRVSEHVALDLSVFAATAERAREAFDGLRSTLESGSEGALRLEPASSARVLAALDELGPRMGGEPLLSYSDRLHLELVSGRPAAPVVEPAQDLAFDTLESYVRGRAARNDAVGQVDIQVRSARPTGPRGGVRLLLAPGQAFQRYRTAQIGAFLASLENDSPAVRVTQLTIERSAHEPDALNPRGWTYAAELTVQAREPAGGV